MNINQNNKLHKQIMKAMKVRVELANLSISEKERKEHLDAISSLSIQAGILNNRI
jgi:hypothetical protein